ncbi:hypothetical protein FAI40_03525 [Acetobacteraceae bacterium]|nr:hypothetical protein FAI40_03525 [Acetobacteraceae bacterium]
MTDTVKSVEGDKGLSDEARTESIEKIYGKEGIELGNEGEKVFAEREAFDEANPNASTVSKLVGEKNAQHDLARSTADEEADKA